MILLSSVPYLEQLDIIADTFHDPEQRTQVFSRIDYTVQLLTIILQFLASSPSNLPPRGLRSGSVRTSVMG